MASKTNQPNREELLTLAEETARRNRDSARVMFQQVLNQDKRNERALMWLAKLSKTPKERKLWLERLLNYYPENQAAKAALENILYKAASTENKTLVLFGVVVAVLIIVAIVVVIAVSSLS